MNCLGRRNAEENLADRIIDILSSPGRQVNRCYTYLIRFVKARLREIKYNPTVPLDNRNNDIYLVEFPKSGVTWLSTIMTNVNFRLLYINKKATFFNIGLHVADIHKTTEVGRQFTENLGFRLIKSHSAYNPYYNFIILLIRNPYDVMLSYYNFMQYDGYDGSFYDFIKSKKYGINKWVQHTESWLYGTTKGEKIHLIKYEHLKENPHAEIMNLYKNIGYDLPKDLISRAIEKSSFENMKESEDFYRAFNPKHVRKFVRVGGVNYKLQKREKEYIFNASKHLIKQLYPELLDDN